MLLVLCSQINLPKKKKMLKVKGKSLYVLIPEIMRVVLPGLAQLFRLSFCSILVELGISW